MDIPGYSQADYDRDRYGSFIAIRIPGMAGRLVDTPVRLDTFYTNLLENHFQTLDFAKLRPLADSPYQNKKNKGHLPLAKPVLFNDAIDSE